MFSDAVEYAINLIESNHVGLHTAAAAAASMFNVDARELVSTLEWSDEPSIREEAGWLTLQDQSTLA